MDNRNFTYMFYGFAIAWLIVMGYVLTLIRRAQTLRRALEQVQRLGEKL